MGVVTTEGDGAKTGRHGSMFSRLCAEGDMKDSHWTNVLEQVQMRFQPRGETDFAHRLDTGRLVEGRGKGA